MKTFFKRPYPAEKTAERKLSAAVLFGLFVFAFLFFLRPFGISQLPDRIFFICLVFGLISSAVMLFFSFVLTELFPKYFSELKWNVGREMAWMLTHILVIGFFNALFAVSLEMGEASFGFFMQFLFYTIVIGIFPVTVSVLLTETQLSKKYIAESKKLSQDLVEHPHSVNNRPEIVLESDNKDEDLVVNPEDILLLAAADNYVEVHYRKSGGLRKHLLRATMKNMEDDLEKFPDFLRVHKSFIVNVSNIRKVSGNAQGYKLHFDDYTDVVPVSRKNNEVFRLRIAMPEK